MSNEKAIKYLEDEGWWDSEDGWSLTTMANVMQEYADQENASLKERVRDLKEKKLTDMQYYMEHCQRDGYITPQEYLEKHRV